ncbi:nose resistant to fluoxetine protein 6-like [Anticarsia gemmatalis]|uniref:nose resistant to fluoxetine protein 6-like n=1 Tax=Anticarsia gemmatalis TaxID=129554 RepID=UPI003F76BE41
MYIDVFFVMSGLFLIKGLMEKKKNPWVSVVSRYFRFIGSFSIIIFYVMFVSMYTGDGPLWQRFAGREQQKSEKSWLWAVLMLNNIIDSQFITPIVAWHIPCDYQLAVMGTLLYVLWTKNIRMAKFVTVLVSILSLIVPVFVTYWHQLPAMLLPDNIEKLFDFPTNEMFLKLYIKSYSRGVPYLIGMAMGYILVMYKPVNNRRILSKEWSIILLSAGYILVFKVPASASSWCHSNDVISPLLFVAFSKMMLSIAVCLIVGAVEYGSIDIIRRIASLHIITVLSRLTFGVFLTHALFIQQNTYSMRALMYHSVMTELTYASGVAVLSFTAAAFLWLFVEAPLNNIVNLVTSSRNNKVEEEIGDQEDKLIKNGKEKIIEGVQKRTTTINAYTKY